jgi:ABC-type branched-subunit amino acid transport system substrate-binding protein
MVVVAPGVRSGHLPEAAEQFVGALSRRLEIEPDSVEPYAVHAAEAVALLLDATGAGDVSRAALVQRLFEGKVNDGMLGAYTVLPSGDIAAQNSPILGFSVYRASAAGAFVLERAIVPSPVLVSAAWGQRSGT